MTQTQRSSFSLLDYSLVSLIIHAAQSHSRVKILMEESPEFILEGTARSLGDEDGYFASTDDDIRDLYLRVTSLTGQEHFIPVPELMSKVSCGAFSVQN